eukprot:1364415-Heterocapsa_arctica.AAC.1
MQAPASVWDGLLQGRRRWRLQEPQNVHRHGRANLSTAVETIPLHRGVGIRSPRPRAGLSTRRCGSQAVPLGA